MSSLNGHGERFSRGKWSRLEVISPYFSFQSRRPRIASPENLDDPTTSQRAWPLSANNSILSQCQIWLSLKLRDFSMVFRCLHTLACLTVFATALPQGWCCWLIPMKCCQTESVQHLLHSGSILTGSSDSSNSCPHCSGLRPHARGWAPHFPGLATGDGPSQDELTLANSPTQLPSAPMPAKECCQRAPLAKSISLVFLAQPLLALGDAFDCTTSGQFAVVPSDIVSDPATDSLRLHARLGRWLC